MKDNGEENGSDWQETSWREEKRGWKGEGESTAAEAERMLRMHKE
jgi:hypothetical protein